MKFGEMDFKEALNFISVLEEDNDIDLDDYKDILVDDIDDEFELTYYADEKNWSLENTTKCSVVIDYQILEACLKGEK